MTDKRAPHRILVIDDDEMLPQVLAQSLRESGYEATVATDGLDGLKLLSNEPFDAIVTDINMPHLNGIELVRLAKTSALNKSTPIVVISGNLNQGTTAKLEQLGLIDVLAKPFELAELHRVLRKRLSRGTQKLAYAAFVVQALCDATAEIFAFYGGKAFACEDPFVQRAKAPPHATTGVIALFGRRAHGSVHVSCDAGFLKHLAALIFVNDAAGLDDAFLANLAGELANQVAGKVKDRLRAANVHVALGIPAVVHGRTELPQMVASPKIAVAVRSSRGAAQAELALADLDEAVPAADESGSSLYLYASP